VQKKGAMVQVEYQPVLADADVAGLVQTLRFK